MKHNKAILYFPANMFGNMKYKIGNALLATTSFPGSRDYSNLKELTLIGILDLVKT
jgi:hypothetical protein